MSRIEKIVIEVDGTPQGIVVKQADGYRFIAVRLPVFKIDGKVFETIPDATRAASEAMGSNTADMGLPA